MIPEESQNPDEIVLEDIKMFHLEQMVKDKSLWIGVSCNDGKLYHLHIDVKENNLAWHWYRCDSDTDWLESFKEKHD